MTRGANYCVPAHAWLHAVVVFMIAVLVYLPTLQNGFAYDDLPIIVLDERVTTFDVERILVEGYWQDTTSALYRPFTSLSYAVDWKLSGGSAVWFHLSNAIWHGAVSALLLLLLRALGAPATPALLAAAVFAVHPVHVEAVANTVGRAELMAAAFVLTAALLWTRPPRDTTRTAGAALLALLSVLALLAKESAAVLPGLLVVIDVVQRRLAPGGVTSWLRTRLLPLAACTAAIALFFALRTLLPGSLTPDNLDPSLEVLVSPAERVMTALQAWPQYARLLFFPRELLADYGPRIMMPALAPGPAVIAGLLLLLACLLGGLLAWERDKPWTAGALLWFAVAVLPVSNLLVPIGVLVAERTLYLPSAALSLGIVAAAQISVTRVSRPGLRPLLAVAAAVAIALLGARTVVRIPDWNSTNSIFAALVRDRPESFRGVWHFARLDAAHGLHASAAQRYGEALQLWPYRRRLVQEAALHANSTGDTARAQTLMTFALERWPDDLVIRRVQSGVLLDRHEYEAAQHHIERGLEFHPRDSLLLRMRDAAARAAPRPR